MYKLLMTTEIKGHFEDGKEWRAKRAICLKTFGEKGKESECIEILKIHKECPPLPENGFEPLYDNRGKCRGFTLCK